MIQKKCGDNKNSVHKFRSLVDEASIIVAYCERCKQRVSVNPKDRRKYMKLFKRDVLQPGTNLYYKEYPHKMSVLY